MSKFKFLFLFFFCTVYMNLFSHPYSPHEKNIEQVEPCNLAITCVFRDEALWLKEWIEYHLLVGVDHFYLYNNCSTDNYLDVLLPYIENGIVELFDFPKQDFTNIDQGYLYNDTLKFAREKTKWLAVIDTDEFINPIECENLKDFLKDKESLACVYIRWQHFGTSGIKNLQLGELLIEKLMFRAPDGNSISEKYGKSIYQAARTLSINGPHFGSFPADSYIYEPFTSKIKVNHYFVRTEDYLYDVKIPRLKIWAAGHIFGSSEVRIANLLDFLEITNSTLDTSMQRYVSPLKEKIYSKL